MKQVADAKQKNKDKAMGVTDDASAHLLSIGISPGYSD